MSEFDFSPGLRIEERIDAAEGEGIFQRWEHGRWLVSEVPAGKRQLPHGFLEGYSTATGVDRRELQRRKQLAEKCVTRDALGGLVSEHKSWHEIANNALPESSAHVSNNSGENEWYTPPEFIEAARAAMGGIDLDPASSAQANEVVKAGQFFTEADNGLGKKWAGRVWMNPPYARPLVDQFSEKLADEFSEERVKQACVLVNNATETSWFQVLTDVTGAVFFPAKRVKFWQPGGDKGAPLQGQAVLYLGPHAEAFRKEFHERISGWSASL